MEYIEGITIRSFLLQFEQSYPDKLLSISSRIGIIMGETIAKIHKTGLVHGDLTTCNFIIEGISEGGFDRISREDRIDLSPEAIKLCVLDFGLNSTSISSEDRSVDLYVLERAFISTHKFSTELWDSVLIGYGRLMGKEGVEIMKRLEIVRARGRKK
eukprot:gnl/Carplike_NY0171/8311_a11531_187.p1 GENE.gnl/Carplike_NY0171/8311_a11531_187~~gnl/Carplike_NY0171/8311_a11531_187.p1  ORF type:complete len:157 (-),score=14.32 gnl/Carplike_NY0171/8311_a11531_187:55-525(-)